MIPSAARTRTACVVTVAVLVFLAAAVVAQRRFFGGFGREPDLHNVPYTGQFTFVRVKYTPAPDGYWAGGRPSWVHGFPIAEWNLMKIMNEVSYLNPRDEETNVLTLDDPDLFRFPIAYIIEVGWWTLTDREADGLRTYLQKGGFVIVDDFKMPGWRGLPGGGWEPFEANMKRVLPAARFVDLEATHPIFHTFFEIHSLENFPQAYNSGHPIFRGLFEENDPARRLQMIVNYNTDISQYWEWSGRGLRPIDDTNEAYKLGVNYIIYGLTH